MAADAKNVMDQGRGCEWMYAKMETENISSFKKFHNLYILLPEVHGKYTQV